MLQKRHHLYEFGPFVLDTAQHALLRNGEPVPLTPKTYDTLLVLVRNSGKMLSKEELMNTLWPDRFVEESNLTQQISMIRKALAESPGEHRYIVTVPGRGYRFAAAVRGRCNQEVESLVGHRPPSEAVIETEDRGKGGDEGRQAPTAGAASEEKITPLQVGSGVGLATVRKELQAPATAEDVQPRSRVGETGTELRWPKQIPKPMLVLVGIALGALIYSLYRQQSIRRHATQGPRSLAILPFRNLRHDADSDFLGFSLADAVITKLGYVSALTVRPSYAVEKYRNGIIDIPRVATDLGVNTLLTANFVREGDRLRLTPQLIDSRTQKIL